MDEFINPGDPDAIRAIIAGGKSKAQMQAETLRSMQPRKTSTSLTENVGAQPTITPAQANAQGSDAWYKKGLDELEKPTDFSAAVESQKQGKTAAERALLLALASGVAGPQYKGVEKYALNRAMNHGPMKVTGATIDENGNIVQDDAFNRERRADILMRRGDVAARGEQAAAERASREQQRAEDRALKLALVGNRSPQEPLVQVQDAEGNITYVPRSQAVGLSPPKKQAAPKLMSETAVKELAALETDADRLGALETTYKPAYGPTVPLTGKATNFVGAQFGTDASNWHSRYQSWSNEVLKRLSGAAVTAPEFARFESAMISPNTPADEVPRRLAQQREALLQGRNKLLESHQKAGYSIGSHEQTTVPGAPAPGQQGSTPSAGGWKIEKAN